MAEPLSCKQFTQLLVDEQPKYDKRIVKSIRPMDGWIGHVATGPFPAFSGTSMYQDKFEHVFPNTSRAWNTVSYANCVGTPCNKTFNTLGWGSSRLQFFLEEQNWQTPLLCFDQMLHVTHAREQFNYIINDIMRPATSQIQSMFLRKRALFWAGKKWAAGANFGQSASQFSHIWANDASGNEVFLLTSVMPTSKLTPQMLANRVAPLTREGYFGSDPFGDGKSPPAIELVSGWETVWELDHLGGQQGIGIGTGIPNVTSNWRFTSFEDSRKYWRYGYSGSIGNFMTRVDPFELRFNFVGNSGNATYPFKFQLVLPYTNIVSSGAGGAAGLKSIPNPDFELACYRMSFIWHRQGMEVLTQETAQINPEMPYGTRNFGGKWRAVLPHVCVDADGVVESIDNRLENQVQFLSTFQLAIRPFHTEWTEAIFHKGEPQCVYAVDTCSTCAHPEQSYSSSNAPC